MFASHHRGLISISAVCVCVSVTLPCDGLHPWSRVYHALVPELPGIHSKLPMTLAISYMENKWSPHK